MSPRLLRRNTAQEAACTGVAPPPAIRLGLGANWRQFTLLVLVNAFVGGMVGLERAVLPLVARQDFGLASRTANLGLGGRRQRAARHQPGPGLVDHGQHEDRPRRPRSGCVRTL
jgi:hypothetical protein